MPDDRLKQWLEQSAIETRRHFDVVAEGLKHDIRVLAEGHQDLADGQKALAAGLEGVNERFDQFHSEARAEFRVARAELKDEIGHLRSEMRAEFKAVRTELKSEIGRVAGLPRSKRPSRP